jgi:hypothetical protein
MKTLRKTVIGAFLCVILMAARQGTAKAATEDQFAYVTVTEAPASQYSIHPTSTRWRVLSGGRLRPISASRAKYMRVATYNDAPPQASMYPAAYYPQPNSVNPELSYNFVPSQPVYTHAPGVYSQAAQAYVPPQAEPSPGTVTPLRPVYTSAPGVYSQAAQAYVPPQAEPSPGTVTPPQPGYALSPGMPGPSYVPPLAEPSPGTVTPPRPVYTSAPGVYSQAAQAYVPPLAEPSPGTMMPPRNYMPQPGYTPNPSAPRQGFVPPRNYAPQPGYTPNPGTAAPRQPGYTPGPSIPGQTFVPRQRGSSPGTVTPPQDYAPSQPRNVPEQNAPAPDYAPEPPGYSSPPAPAPNYGWPAGNGEEPYSPTTRYYPTSDE